MVSAGRAPAGWKNGDLRSATLPFFAQKGEIAILKKCDVFIDKPAVFVYLHLRVGM